MHGRTPNKWCFFVTFNSVDIGTVSDQYSVFRYTSLILTGWNIYGYKVSKTYFFWKQPISSDFRGVNQILLVDLASAEKIILTIREDFSKILFSTTIFFISKKLRFFRKILSRFFEKNILFPELIFHFFLADGWDDFFPLMPNLPVEFFFNIENLEIAFQKK